jgi:hypothetical protein
MCLPKIAPAPARQGNDVFGQPLQAGVTARMYLGLCIQPGVVNNQSILNPCRHVLAMTPNPAAPHTPVYDRSAVNLVTVNVAGPPVNASVPIW